MKLTSVLCLLSTGSCVIWIRHFQRKSKEQRDNQEQSHVSLSSWLLWPSLIVQTRQTLRDHIAIHACVFIDIWTNRSLSLLYSYFSYLWSIYRRISTINSSIAFKDKSYIRQTGRNKSILVRKTIERRKSGKKEKRQKRRKRQAFS